MPRHFASNHRVEKRERRERRHNIEHEDEEKKSESNRQQFKYHKRTKASTKRKMIKEEFKYLNKTLTEVVDHLEDELEHVRTVNAEMEQQMDGSTDNAPLSPTESMSISSSRRESISRRPSQIKFAYENAIQKMKKMKQSQHTNHIIIRSLREKIRKQAETISELPSEQEIKRLVEQIKTLLYELSEYILFLDIDIEVNSASANGHHSKYSNIREERYVTERRKNDVSDRYYQDSIESTDDGYRGGKTVKKIIETTETHQRSPRRSPRKPPRKHHDSSRVITEHHYHETHESKEPKPQRIYYESSEDEEIENLKTVLKETKVTLEDIHFEDSYDDSIHAPKEISRRNDHHQHHQHHHHEIIMIDEQSIVESDKQRRRSEWRSSVNALELRQEEVIPKSVHDEQIKALLEKNKLLQQRVDSLEKDFNSQKIKYESEIITKVEIIETIRKELEGTEHDLDEMESKYEKISIKYQHICHEFDKAIQEFNQGNDALINRNKKLKIKLEESLSRQVIEIKEKDELLIKVQILQKEKAKLRRHCMEYSKIYEEIEIKHEIIEEYHAKTIDVNAKASKNADNEDKEKEILKLREKIEKLTKEIEDMHKQQQAAKSETQSTEILMRESKNKIAALKEYRDETLIDELKAAIKELKEENEELKKHKEDENESKLVSEDKQKEIERLKVELQKLKEHNSENFQTKIDILEKQIANKEKEKTELIHKIEALENQINKDDNKSKDIEEKKEELKNQNKELQKYLDEKTKALAKATSEIKELEQQLKNDNNKSKDTEKENKELQKELNEKIQALEKATSETKDISAKKDELKQQNKELQKYLDEKTEDLANAKSELEQLKMDKASSQSKRTSVALNQAFYKWQMDLTEQLNECSKDNDDIVQSYDNQLQQIGKADDLVSTLMNKPIIKKKRKRKSRKNSKTKSTKVEPKTSKK